MIDWKRVLDLRDKVGPDRLVALLDRALLDIEMRLRGLDARPQDLARELPVLRRAAAEMGFLGCSALCCKAEEQLARQGHLDLGTAALKASFGHARQTFLRDLPLVMARAPSGSGPPRPP